jgi:hypothetical protein
MWIRWRSRLLPLSAVTALSLAALSCVPEIEVILRTRIYADGGVDRRIEISARTGEGKVPEEVDWLQDSAGVTLADPEGWDRVETGPGYMAAEGFFPSADQVSGTLRHVEESEPAADRNRIEFAGEDLGILTRRVYRELYGDPYSSEDAAVALHQLLDLFLEGLAEELRLSFGDGLDRGPVHTLFHEDVHDMITELLEVNREASGKERQAERQRRWGEILSEYGVPAVGGAPDDFWDDNSAPVVEWLGSSIASALSTPEEPVLRDDLDFWPEPGDGDGLERVMEMAERAAGGEEDLDRIAEPLLTSVLGYYSDEGGARYRFRMHLSLPGTLLKTNGTPGEEGIIWFFRGEDLFSGDRLMEAVTAEPDPDALRALGARRHLEPAVLLQIVDLLAERDPEGSLKEILREAVRMGRLDLLRDADSVPEELRRNARELADLLDPEVEDRYPGR